MPRRKVQKEAAEEAKGEKNCEKPRKKMKNYKCFFKKFQDVFPPPPGPGFPVSLSTSTTAAKGQHPTTAPPPLCAELSPTPTGPELLKYIRNVSFTSEFSKNGLVRHELPQKGVFSILDLLNSCDLSKCIFSFYLCIPTKLRAMYLVEAFSRLTWGFIARSCTSTTEFYLCYEPSTS